MNKVYLQSLDKGMATPQNFQPRKKSSPYRRLTFREVTRSQSETAGASQKDDARHHRNDGGVTAALGTSKALRKIQKLTVQPSYGALLT